MILHHGPIFPGRVRLLSQPSLPKTQGQNELTGPSPRGVQPSNCFELGWLSEWRLASDRDKPNNHPGHELNPCLLSVEASFKPQGSWAAEPWAVSSRTSGSLMYREHALLAAMLSLKAGCPERTPGRMGVLGTLQYHMCL